jgi:hypothetical protein
MVTASWTNELYLTAHGLSDSRQFLMPWRLRTNTIHRFAAPSLPPVSALRGVHILPCRTRMLRRFFPRLPHSGLRLANPRPIEPAHEQCYAAAAHPRDRTCSWEHSSPGSYCRQHGYFGRFKRWLAFPRTEEGFAVSAAGGRAADFRGHRRHGIPAVEARDAADRGWAAGQR